MSSGLYSGSPFEPIERCPCCVSVKPLSRNSWFKREARKEEAAEMSAKSVRGLPNSQEIMDWKERQLLSRILKSPKPDYSDCKELAERLSWRMEN